MSYGDHSPAEVLRSALVARSCGLLAPSTPWPVFVDHLPDGVADNAICVYVTMGTNDGHNMRTKATTDHPGFQVRVRAADYRTGYVRAQLISLALDAILQDGVALDGDFYTIQAAHRKGSILPLGQGDDEKRRDSFTINGIFTINPT